MKSYVVFLRGVNVNGIKIKMGDLKTVIEKLGYKEVKTTLATGNVSFLADQEYSDEEHKERIEAALRKAFNYEAFVVLMEKSVLDEILSEVETMTIQNDFNHYILLSNEPNLGKILNELFETCSTAEGEKLIVSNQAIYWIVKKGETLKTEFGKKVLGSSRYKAILTSRNISTLKKIAKD